MPTPSVSFSHAGIFVTDLELMVNFYQTILGLTVTDRGVLEGTEIVFMSADPTEHHQVVLATGRPKGAATTVNQLSFKVGSLPELRELQAMLRAAGVAPLAPTSHGNAISVYFHDPEGNRIEFFVDTPWHVAQPRRIPIDLDRAENEIWQEVGGMVPDLPDYQPATERHSAMRTLMRRS